MGFLRRRKEEREATLIATMATALGAALTGILTAQSKQVEQNSAFIGQLQDLSAKKAAVIMGQRGGRVTAERKKKAKAAARSAVSCVLCVNPMHRGVTLEQIQFHRLHEGTSGGTVQETPAVSVAGPTEEVGN